MPSTTSPCAISASSISHARGPTGHDVEGSPEPTSPEQPSKGPKSKISGSSLATGARAADEDAPAIVTRRRITRACDECRRKKTKCNGKQPCTNCTVNGLECGYDKRSDRQRYQTRLYIESLEKRLERAETLLRKLDPALDLESQRLPGETTSQQRQTRPSESREPTAATLTPEAQLRPDSEATADDVRPMTLTDSIGQLNLSEEGEWDFHGLSSGAVFLGRISEHISGLLGHDTRIPFLSRAPRPSVQLPLDGTPGYLGGDPWRVGPDIYQLPPQDLARTLCDYSLNSATCLVGIVHVPSFYRMFDRLYEKPVHLYTNEDQRFLGLFYAVLALGSMYDVDENNPFNPNHYAVAMDEGFKYYILARSFLRDLAECRDMTTLQALLFIVQFYQATSNLNGCHAFVGIALRAALRMGLHRHLPHARMSAIEDETRRRVFHAIRQMDIYLAAMLGLPLLLDDEDIDQPLPTEVDDKYITENGIIASPLGAHSFFGAFNAHTKLMRILAKIIKHIYPPKGINQTVVRGKGTQVTYVVSYARIQEIERDLQDWYEQLPATWRPGPDGPLQVVRIRILLRFAYAYVQMMLYRPFLHYVSQQSSSSSPSPLNDERYSAYASAGIRVCRNIVHIGAETQKQAVLIGPYWFSMYTQFFAVLSLLVFILHNPGISGGSDILSDAKLGREVITSLTCRSLTADRVAEILNSLFNQLFDAFKDKQKPMSSQDHSPSVYQANASVASNQSAAYTEQFESNHVRRMKMGESHRKLSNHSQIDRSGMQDLDATQSGAGYGNLQGVIMDTAMFNSDNPFAYPEHTLAPSFSSSLGLMGPESDPTWSYEKDLIQLSLPQTQPDMPAAEHGFMGEEEAQHSMHLNIPIYLDSLQQTLPSGGIFDSQAGSSQQQTGNILEGFSFL